MRRFAVLLALALLFAALAPDNAPSSTNKRFGLVGYPMTYGGGNINGWVGDTLCRMMLRHLRMNTINLSGWVPCPVCVNDTPYAYLHLYDPYVHHGDTVLYYGPTYWANGRWSVWEPESADPNDTTWKSAFGFRDLSDGDAVFTRHLNRWCVGFRKTSCDPGAVFLGPVYMDTALNDVDECGYLQNVSLRNVHTGETQVVAVYKALFSIEVDNAASPTTPVLTIRRRMHKWAYNSSSSVDSVVTLTAGPFQNGWKDTVLFTYWRPVDGAASDTIPWTMMYTSFEFEFLDSADVYFSGLEIYDDSIGEAIKYEQDTIDDFIRSWWVDFDSVDLGDWADDDRREKMTIYLYDEPWSLDLYRPCSIASEITANVMGFSTAHVFLKMGGYGYYKPWYHPQIMNYDQTMYREYLIRAPSPTVLYTEQYSLFDNTYYGGGYTGRDSLPRRNLQDALDNQADRMRWHRSLADSFAADWWFHAQGLALDKNGNDVWGDSADLRFPTAEELMCITGLALANGVDGFFYWCLGSIEGEGDGYEHQRGFLNNYISYSSTVGSTVAARQRRDLATRGMWDVVADSDSVNTRGGGFGALVMDTLVPCLDSLAWVWSWCEDWMHATMPPYPQDTAEHPPVGSFIDDVKAHLLEETSYWDRADSGYVHVGQFVDSANASKWEEGQRWFMLVNRSCSVWGPSEAWRKPASPQIDSVFFDLPVPGPDSAWAVWEANTGTWRPITVHPDMEDPILIDTLGPGGLTLYRVGKVMY